MLAKKFWPVPWQTKVAAKLVLAHLPVPYRAWKSLHLFEHGNMQRAEYALRGARYHLAPWLTQQQGSAEPWHGLELGPGDSVASALIAKALGAERVWLVDVGPFASREVALYRRIAAELRDADLEVPDLAAAASFEDVLAACGAVYLTEGTASLGQVPTASIDGCWSHAVLEHVRRAEFAPLLGELARVSKPCAVHSHKIDLRDHLRYALNSLRFSERIWESSTFARAGFYTNRLRRHEILALFEAAGFAAEVTDESSWERLPTPRRAMVEPFRSMPEEELLCAGFRAILRPLGSVPAAQVNQACRPTITHPEPNGWCPGAWEEEPVEQRA